jgi:uncharacterized protein YyaL (SSP411 family)
MANPSNAAPVSASRWIMSSNLLASETSPFLLLHKDNPVHWRPWGQDALAEAQTTGKPILLSIGYTACHWCHVMNQESFADPEIAELMNENFINIKVDREERPDIDQIYQTAANAMGHAGGWPLTIFLTSQGEPFVTGSYFPKEDRLGLPAFRRVLPDVVRLYHDQPEPVAGAVARVQATFAQLWGRDLRGPLDTNTLDFSAVKVAQRFDIFYGGMTGAPKFPTTGLCEVLWRGYLRTGAAQFGQLVQTTLDNISLGGLYDHVSGGFFRYATDERWFIPHFEKMLYDNALLIDLLTIVARHARLPQYVDRIQDTIGWVLREMMVEDAFASSIDADGGGEEGRYYSWSEAEIDAALMGTFVQRFKEAYGVQREGSFRGRNILHRFGRIPYPLSDADEALLRKQRELLLGTRNRRPARLRDDKVLADWNGMMIASLAHAGMVFRNPQWLGAAVKAFDFVVRVLGDGDRLHHSWRAGQCGHRGFADDYAHMARAGLMLWQATGETRFLDQTCRWVNTLNEHFWDSQNGGYFYTADDADPLIYRARMVFDQNSPSANGVMTSLLAHLHAITADQAYRDRGNALIQAFSGEVGRALNSMGTFLNGFDTAVAGLSIVILGPRNQTKTQELIAAVMGRSLPQLVIHVVDNSKALPPDHPVHGKPMENGQPTAFICQRMTCSAPITNPVALSQVLQLPPQRPQGTA